MGKYLQTGLVLVYVLLTIVAFLVALMVLGVRISPLAQWLVIGGWLVLCFCSRPVREKLGATDGETVWGAALRMAALLPRSVNALFRLVIVVCVIVYVRAKWVGVAVLMLLLVVLLYRLHLLSAAIPLLIFWPLSAMLTAVFLILNRKLTRIL